MSRLQNILTYAGTLPFIICTALLFTGVENLPIMGNTLAALCFYSLVICSFISGSVWGLLLNSSIKIAKLLLITSNLIAVLLWLFFAIMPPLVVMLFMITMFVVLLAIDGLLYRNQIISKDYYNLRFKATLIVVITLAAASGIINN